MRVSVALGGCAVSGPPGMGDADLPPDRLLFEGFLQGADLAPGPQAHQVIGAIQDRETGRIVAPVLQPPQSLHEDGNDIPLGYCPDDSAHIKDFLTTYENVCS